MLNFYLFLCFSAGIILGKAFNSFYLPFFLGSACLCFAYIFYKRRKLRLSNLSYFLFFIFLGAVWVFPYARGESLTGNKHEGVFLFKVTSLPRNTGSQQRFLAQIERKNGTSFSVKTYVRDYSPVIKEYLSRYEVKGKLVPSRYKSRLFYTLWIKKDASQVKIKDSFVTLFLRGITYKIMDVYRNTLTCEAEQFMSSVFLGRREVLSRQIKDACKTAGVAHLLAVSGLHMGLVSAVIFYLLKFLGIKFRARIVCALIGVYMYALLVGAQPANVRAAIMCSTFGVSFLLKRRTYLLNSLGIAGLVSLLLRPLWLFEVGFQLSYLAVGAILIGYKVCNVGIRARGVFLTYLKNTFSSSLFVAIGIIPLTAHYFYSIYLFSMVSNIVLIPIFTFLIMVNFILLFFSPIHFLAQLAGASLSFGVFLFVKTTSFISSLPLVRLTVRFSLGGVIAYYIALGTAVGGLLWLRKTKSAHRQRMPSVSN